ncbi:MAG: hypothetical protein HYU51_15980 [Candidatus Rokubacteria bacterium]|nr:hypothetical protein [Candidatus Rokubacteria bacterium]
MIRWDEDEQTVHLWSASPVVWRKMGRLGIVPVKETKLSTGEPSGKFYRVPLSEFRWGLKRRGTSRGNPAALARARASGPKPVTEPA